MNYKRLIEETKSTRDFKKKVVPEKVIRKIMDFAKATTTLFEEQKIGIHYFDNGEEIYEALQGVAGFNGIMHKAPQYLLFTSDNKENHQINIGYFVQQILLKLQELEVDSCWITIPEDGEIVKEILNIQDQKEPAALVAIGYDNNEIKVINRFHFGENYSKTNMKVVENNVSARLSMEQVVYLDHWGNNGSTEKLEEMGLDDVFRYIVLAPSSFNRQPWRFVLKENTLYLAIRQDPGVNIELDFLDAGIVMLYIEILMKEFSILGKWHVETDVKMKEIPENYKYIGFFAQQ